MGAVLRFPQPHRVHCCACGIAFRPLAPHHRYCVRCYWGSQAAAHIARAKRLLQGAR